MTNKGKFGQEYFKDRARCPTAVFKGKDLAFLKYPFWDRHIGKHIHSGRLLDIGCAEGAFLKWAEKRGYKTHGIDISEFAIKELSQQKLSQTKLFVADITSLPFVDNYFYVITCFDVLEHLEYPIIGLREISRCLKEPGLFIMSVPNIYSKGLKWKGANWFGYRDVTHVSLLSGEQWNKLLEESDFRVIDRFYDTLWDSPYFKHMPKLLQHAFFKLSLLIFYWTPVRFSEKWGENLYLVATKISKRSIPEGLLHG